MKIAKGLALPVNVVTQKLAMLGRTGSGKSYAATKLAELMHEAGGQFVTLDPVGIWWGLRLGKDGSKKGGLSIPVFGGLHGDVPLEPTAGELIANLVCDKGISAILDVSQFESDRDIARFATDFGRKLFQRRKAKPSAMHLFLEEAQTFIPQNAMDNYEKWMLHEFHKICKLGRNFGIGVDIISQRPQEVNKKALNQSECLFVFQLTGRHEREAVQKWIEDKGLSDEFMSDITKLEQGHAHIWSPAWLKVSEVYHILPKNTFDASSTPEVGKTQKTQELAQIDLKFLSEEIKKTVEKAKENDPAELKKRVSELESELKKVNDTKDIGVLPTKERLDKIKLQAKKAAEKELHILYKPLLKQRDNLLYKIEEIVNNLSRSIDDFPSVADYLKILDKPLELPEERLDEVFNTYTDIAEYNPNKGNKSVISGNIGPGVHAEIKMHSNNIGTIEKVGVLGKGELAVLKVLGMYSEQGADREMISLLTGQKRSTRDAYIQRLAAKGYCSTVNGGNVFITKAGIEILGNDYQRLPTGAELIKYWLQRLSGGEQQILNIIANNPNGITREEIDRLTGYKRSTRDAYIQRLTLRKLLISGNGKVQLNPKIYG
jgi:energy-coupling factor transporter ATP-binding protein EcfA2